VNCAVKRINEPVGFLARTNGEFAVMLDVPGYRHVLPGKTARHTDASLAAFVDRLTLLPPGDGGMNHCRPNQGR
jgi:hypothetical protein